MHMASMGRISLVAGGAVWQQPVAAVGPRCYQGNVAASHCCTEYPHLSRGHTPQAAGYTVYHSTRL